MTNLEILSFAFHLMLACNKAHKSTYGIFMDAEFKTEDETIQFDMLTSNLEHATQLCSLLNLTLSIEANSDPQSDKTLNYFIN